MHVRVAHRARAETKRDCIPSPTFAACPLEGHLHLISSCASCPSWWSPVAEESGFGRDRDRHGFANPATCPRSHDFFLRPLDQSAQSLEPARGRRAVDDAVVEGQAERNGLSSNNVTIHNNWRVGDAPDSKDRRLRQIDDGRKVVDVEHAKICDSERASSQVAFDKTA